LKYYLIRMKLPPTRSHLISMLRSNTNTMFLEHIEIKRYKFDNFGKYCNECCQYISEEIKIRVTQFNDRFP